MFCFTNCFTTFVKQLTNTMKLKKEIKQKLLSDNYYTLHIAIKMNCTQAAIKALIKRDSEKLCHLNYAVLIQQVLKLNKKTKIYD